MIDYGYNSDDQLVSIRKNVNGQEVQNITYGYDHDGIRLTKTVNGERYFFHRDTNGEIFTITKEDTTSQDVMNFYRDGEGNLLSFRYNEVLYYYQFNARGDVIALTDSAGNVKVTYDYDEWGNVIGTTGDQTLAEANPYRYVGKFGVLYDADANTYLMGWRDFDPTTGRFIVPDTYEGEDDEPTTLNRYLYAEGDPVNNIDPDGNFGKWLQAAWKVTKKAYNFAIGDDIRTLTSPKTKWYQKLGAADMIASNFVSGLGQAKWAIKGAKAGLKASKAVKTIRYARSLKVTKKVKLAKAIANKGLFRASKNLGVFKGISEPMKLKHVKKIAKDAGIGLKGVKVEIIKDPNLIGKNIAGHAKGITIQLYPDAFSSKEELVKTLEHERMHIYQEKVFGAPKDYLSLIEYENAARNSESLWWKYYQKERTMNNMTDTKEWRDLIPIILSKDGNKNDLKCPICNNNSISHDFVSEKEEKTGFLVIWCNLCNVGIHVSRATIPDHESITPSKNGNKIPNFKLLD